MSDMVTIREEDLIESVADALQFISYYHPMDYIRALGQAYEAEQGPATKDAIAQILTNSRLCAEGHRPICQDTGIVNVFVKWGQDCRLDSARSLQEVVDEGVRRAYTLPENKLRASILADPAFTRRNTRDNTPCALSIEMVPGRTVSIGAGAHGKLSFPHRVVRQTRWRDPETYMDRALAGRALSQSEEVSRDNLPFEFMLNALRLREGFALQDFMDRTGMPLSRIEAPLAKAERLVRLTSLPSPGLDLENSGIASLTA